MQLPGEEELTIFGQRPQFVVNNQLKLVNVYPYLLKVWLDLRFIGKSLL